MSDDKKLAVIFLDNFKIIFHRVRLHRLTNHASATALSPPTSRPTVASCPSVVGFSRHRRLSIRRTTTWTSRFEIMHNIAILPLRSLSRTPMPAIAPLLRAFTRSLSGTEKPRLSVMFDAGIVLAVMALSSQNEPRVIDQDTKPSGAFM